MDKGYTYMISQITITVYKIWLLTETYLLLQVIKKKKHLKDPKGSRLLLKL